MNCVKGHSVMKLRTTVLKGNSVFTSYGFLNSFFSVNPGYYIGMLNAALYYRTHGSLLESGCLYIHFSVRCLSGLVETLKFMSTHIVHSELCRPLLY